MGSGDGDSISGAAADLLDREAGHDCPAHLLNSLHEAVENSAISPADVSEPLLLTRVLLPRGVEAPDRCPDEAGGREIAGRTEFAFQERFPHFLIDRLAENANQPGFNRLALKSNTIFDARGIHDPQAKTKLLPQ